MELAGEVAPRRSTVTSLTAFVASAALVATGIASLAWRYLPYTRLERFSADERFLLWEGVVWLFALLFTFLGLASILEVLGLRIREGMAEFGRLLRGFELKNLPVTGPAILPWWMLTCGLILMLIGIVTRLLAGP
jgi:hypothetical protein